MAGLQPIYKFFQTGYDSLTKRPLQKSSGKNIGKRYLSGFSWPWVGVKSFTENLSEIEALSATPLFSALLALGDTMASLDKYVIYQKNPREKERMWNSSIERLLQNPSRFYTGFEFFQTMTAYCTLYGNAYAIIQRNQSNTPVGLHMVHPASAYARVDYNSGELYYDVQLMWGEESSKAKRLIVDWSDMIHIKRLAFNNAHLHGVNTMYVHGSTYKSAIYARESNNNFMKQGSHIPGVLQTDSPLEEDEVLAVQEDWKKDIAGVANAGNVPVLHSGLQYMHLKALPKDAMFHETSKLSVSEICRITRVPPHMLYDLTRSSFNNIEQQSREFAINTVRPYARLWESELNRKLFSTRDFNKRKVVFDLRSLLDGDTEARAEYYRTMFMTGAMSPNDIREREGDNPRPEDGDLYFTPLNMTPDPLATNQPLGNDPTQNINDGNVQPD